MCDLSSNTMKTYRIFKEKSSVLHPSQEMSKIAAKPVTLISNVQSGWLCYPVHFVVTLEAAQALQLWFIIHLISSGNVCPPVMLIQPSALRQFLKVDVGIWTGDVNVYCCSILFSGCPCHSSTCLCIAKRPLLLKDYAWIWRNFLITDVRCWKSTFAALAFFSFLLNFTLKDKEQFGCK